MIRPLFNETFKKIDIEYPLTFNYAISNFGRLVSYTDDVLQGKELNGGMAEGFRVFSFYVRVNGKKKSITNQFSRLVAKYFIENDDQANKKFVIHLDHNKLNDRVENLKWATQKEVTEHNKSNPLVIAGREKTIQHNLKADGRKLTSTQVIRIKKMLQREDNKTRLVLIAKQFNISTQQLWRIKTGENWSHIKV
jgi:hypothetical protein